MKIMNIVLIVLACGFLIMLGFIIYDIVGMTSSEPNNAPFLSDYMVNEGAEPNDSSDMFEVEEHDVDELYDTAEDDIEPIYHSHLPIIPGLERDDEGILIGSIVFDEPEYFKGAPHVLNVRSGPTTDARIVTQITRGQVVRASEVVDGWYRVVVLPGMFDGFIRSDFLLRNDDSIRYFAQPHTVTIEHRGNEYQVTLVDVRTIIPDIDYRIIFATPDNFTGRTLYPRDVPLLQQGTAEKLRAAQEIFAQYGYRIRLYDAYRPMSVSGILYDIVQDRRYVAPPGASTHNRAAAVDITLIDRYGNELEMPSAMHTFNETSHRNSPTMSDEARANMDFLTYVMRQVGFTTISSEWWHFNDSDSRRYPPMEIHFRELRFFQVNSQG